MSNLSHRLASYFCRVRDGLHKLNLPVSQPTDAHGVAAAYGSDSDSSTGSDSNADSYCSTSDSSDSSAFEGKPRLCEELAALTLLLTTDAEFEDVQGYADSRAGSCPEVLHALLELLDDAYEIVRTHSFSWRLALLLTRSVAAIISEHFWVMRHCSIKQEVMLQGVGMMQVYPHIQQQFCSSLPKMLILLKTATCLSC